MQGLSNSVPENFSVRIVPDMDWHDRLNDALKAKNWSIPDLARALGSPNDEAVLNRLYKYTAGEVKNPRGNWMVQIASAIGETEEYLRFGIKQLGGTIDGPKTIRPSGPETSDVVKVGEGWPDVGGEWMDVRGVSVGGNDSYFYFGDVIDQVRRPPGIRNAKNVAALNVAGDSMLERFQPGELIYIQLREPAPGDDVVIELYPENDGDAPKSFLKRLVRKTGRQIECIQLNPRSEINFDRGEVSNLWRVLTLRDLLG